MHRVDLGGIRRRARCWVWRVSGVECHLWGQHAFEEKKDLEGLGGVDGVARYVYVISLLRMMKSVELDAEGFWLFAAVFTMITFAIVTDQYRTSRYTGFLYAHYGQFLPIVLIKERES